MRRVPFICCLLAAAAPASAWTPAPLGRWDLPAGRGAAVTLQLDGDLALVGADDTADNGNPGGWFWAVDLSDPAAPVQRAELELTGVPADIARHGDIAAVVWYHVRINRGALALIDLGDPPPPGIAAEATVFGAPTAVAWLPPYVVTAVRGTGAGIGDHLLVQYAADPGNPVYADTVLLPFAPSALALGDGLLYVSGDAGSLAQLEWFDTSDPSDMTLVDSWGLSLHFVALDVQGDLLHTLRESGDYVLVDLSGDYLWFRAALDLPSPPGGLARSGDAIYAAAGGNLTVIGAGDPDHPFTAGTFADGAAADVALGADVCALLDATGLWTLPLFDGPTPVFVSGFRAADADRAVLLRW
ncbi:hypothetical protein KJ554_05175, partial [bacterium]|nr:hypothetical protein [bacterium]